MTEIMAMIDEENWKRVEREREDIAKKVGGLKIAINGLIGKVERLEQGLLSMTNRQESMEKKLRSILEQSERIEQNMIVGSTRYDTIDQSLKHLNEKHETIMQIMAEECGEWNPLAKENLNVEANYMFDELHPSYSFEFQHRSCQLLDKLPQSNLMDLIESEVIANSSSKENVAMMFDEMPKDFVAPLQVDNQERCAELPLGKQLKFEEAAIVDSTHSSDKFTLKFEHFPLAGSKEIDQKLILLVSRKDNGLAEERLEGVDQKHVLNQWINSATQSLVHFVWDPEILDCR